MDSQNFMKNMIIFNGTSCMCDKFTDTEWLGPIKNLNEENNELCSLPKLVSELKNNLKILTKDFALFDNLMFHKCNDNQIFLQKLSLKDDTDCEMCENCSEREEYDESSLSENILNDLKIYQESVDLIKSYTYYDDVQLWEELFLDEKTCKFCRKYIKTKLLLENEITENFYKINFEKISSELKKILLQEGMDENIQSYGKYFNKNDNIRRHFYTILSIRYFLNFFEKYYENIPIVELKNLFLGENIFSCSPKNYFLKTEEGIDENGKILLKEQFKRFIDENYNESYKKYLSENFFSL